jgi:transposase
VSDEHHCEWRVRAEQLETALAQTTAQLTSELGQATAALAAGNARIAEQDATLQRFSEEMTTMRGTLEKLQRHVFGKRSEKMPRVADELRDPADAEAARVAALELREENAALRRQIGTRRIEHKVPEAKKICPRCGGREFTPLGEGKLTEMYELVAARVERLLHVQEKQRCRCGEFIVTADPPDKVFDKTRFGPTFMAQVAVSKCADSIPLYRQAKAWRRAGVPVNDSTLGDLFHATARASNVLYERLLALVAANPLVLADETKMPVLAKGKTRTAWIWDFIARDEDEKTLIAYVYSNSRSGETPVRVLADTVGKLLVDGYIVYDQVTIPGGRERAGCLAHVRRKFFDALSTAPAEAREAMAFILDLYRVEHAAWAAGVEHTLSHLAMRQERSRPVMDAFHAWLKAEQPRHLPKGPIGDAIKYAINQWDALSLFLTDPALPLDNNESERALRVCALGRKNFLFVGSDGAGENLAGLYSLIATCEANGVNPVEYLADVLIRVQTQPAKQLDELLPHRWTPQRPAPSA